MNVMRHRGLWATARRVGVALFLLLALGTVVVPVAADDGPPANNVTPRSGPAAGGTAVTIVGDHFTGVTQVFFGDTAATDVSVNGAGTQIAATTPAHAPGPVGVFIVPPGGAQTTNTTATNGRVLEGIFTFTGIAAVRPDSGPTSGGTPFAIVGFGFPSGPHVLFDGIEASNVQFLEENTLIGRTPAHPAGQVDIVVRNQDASLSFTKTAAFTYADTPPNGAPTVVSVDPNTGPTTGAPTTSHDGDHGNFVSITGTNFLPGATVTFDTTAAQPVVFVSATRLYVAPPPHPAGTVPVTVTNPDNQSGTLANAFTYVTGQNSPLAIREIEPSSGPTGPTEARLVKIEGTGFAQGATVSFGSAAGLHVTVNHDGTEIVTNAPDQVAGTYDVTVTNPDTTFVTKPQAYTYFVPVRVASIDPRSGPAAGGTPFTLTGSNFQQGATVSFDDQRATNVVVSVDGTQITGNTPAHHAGVVTILVANTDHSRGYLPFGFVFTGGDPPTTTLAIREVAPKIGPVAGGVHVIIRGSGFTANTTVTFDTTTVAASNVTLLDSQTLVVITPAHAAGKVNVAVTEGATSATWDDQYRYADPTSTRQTWDDPTAHVDGTPDSAPGGRGSGTNKPTGAAGATAVGGTAPAPTSR